MVGNAFDQNVNYLVDAHRTIERIQELTAAVEQSDQEEKRLEKSLIQEQKNQDDELATTIKKRKSQIDASYEKEIEVVRGKIKKLQLQRNKKKSRKIDERYQEETQDLRETNQKLEFDLKTEAKQAKAPRICRASWYYALFMPRRIIDGIAILALVLFCSILFPGVIGYFEHQFVHHGESLKASYYALVHIGCSSLFLNIYLLIALFTKTKYRELLFKGREVKTTVAANKKKMKAIKNSIQKDVDESGYGLDSYDSQLQGLEDEMVAIAEHKKEALATFESDTRPIVEQEIMTAHANQIATLKANVKAAQEYQSQALNEIQELNLYLTNEYEAFLGKEWIKIEKVEALIDVMQDEGIPTVGEAIAALTGRSN